MKEKKNELEAVLKHIDKTFADVDKAIEQAAKPKRKCCKKK